MNPSNGNALYSEIMKEIKSVKLALVYFILVLLIFPHLSFWERTDSFAISEKMSLTN